MLAPVPAVLQRYASAFAGDADLTWNDNILAAIPKQVAACERIPDLRMTIAAVMNEGGAITDLL